MADAIALVIFKGWFIPTCNCNGYFSRMLFENNVFLYVGDDVHVFQFTLVINRSVPFATENLNANSNKLETEIS